jgi:excisionase family DNA binding protein
LKIFEILLDKLSRDGQFFILSEDEELTTQEAAEILNVSRPFVVKQVECGEIPHKKVGSHRRLLLKDILAYQKRMQKERNKALQELADLAQKHNMGY